MCASRACLQALLRHTLATLPFSQTCVPASHRECMGLLSTPKLPQALTLTGVTLVCDCMQACRREVSVHADQMRSSNIGRQEGAEPGTE